MSFLVLCFILAFVFESMVLHTVSKRIFAVLAFLLMESLPVGGMLYAIIARPSGFIFDWRADAVFCLYIAGAVLLGCGAAWLVRVLRKLS